MGLVKKKKGGGGDEKQTTVVLTSPEGYSREVREKKNEETSKDESSVKLTGHEKGDDFWAGYQTNFSKTLSTHT